MYMYGMANMKVNLDDICCQSETANMHFPLRKYRRQRLIGLIFDKYEKSQYANMV